MNDGAESQVTPTQAPPLAAPAPVVVWGRAFPRASGTERLAWATILLLVVSVLVTAMAITPDPRGHGTHEQIKILGRPLDACGFKVMTGRPCPSCGFTTTFALAMHGRPLDAFVNQPFGFLVFAFAVVLVPVSAIAAVRGPALSLALDRWPWGRIFFVTLLLWLAGWGYKCAVTS